MVRAGQKRKSSHCSDTLSWMPPQSLDSLAAIQEAQLASCPSKRKRQRPPSSTVCPELIVIDEDSSDDHMAQSAVEAVMLSPPAPMSIENDDKHVDLEHSPFPSFCTTPNKTIYSLEPANFDECSNLDILFDQYLRSPSLSPSPSPDEAASESSEATLINVEPDRSRSNTEPCMEASGILTPEDKLEHEVARGQGPCHIRLRVSQPKITLRFKFQDTSQSEKKKTKTKRGKKGKKDR